ncbi:MAG: hypothetical protein ACP5I3_04140 [Thermoproteus sp.]
MLSKKADLKNSELLGVLAASILCAKQGCEADGPEIAIGLLSLRLYQGQTRQEAKRERKGQLSLLDLAGGRARQEAPRPKPAEKPRQPREAKKEPTAESRPKPAVQAERKEPAKEEREKAEKAEAGPSEGRSEPAAGAGPAGGKIDLAYLAETASDVLGLDAREARRLLEAVLLYLSNYPSVGLLRFFEDLRRATKADPDTLKKVLNILRSYDIVELHELGVVNLKKRVELKRETKL